MSYNPTGGKTYTLASSIGSTDTTILLTSFQEPVSNTPYTMAIINSDIAYATLAPKTTSTEFISFTGITQNGDGTATLTGVTRGLSRSSPFTSSATFKLPHSGQTQLVLSNSPQQINEYVTIRNAETISGIKTFSAFPITPSSAPTTNYQVANKKYVDDTTSVGVADATTTTAGKVLQATQAEVDAKASTGNDGGAVSRTLFQNPSTIRAGKYHDYVVDTGIADAYAIAPTPAVTAYQVGQVFTFKAANANTGASTLNVNGLGTMAIKKLNTNTDLVAGDIAAGEIVMVSTDGTIAALVSPVANAPMPLSYLDTTTTLGTSDTKVPSQNATKVYADSQTLLKSLSTTDFETAARFGAGTSNGTNTFGTIGLVQDTTTTTTSYARINWSPNATGGSQNDIFAGNPIFRTTVVPSVIGTSGAAYAGLGTVTTDGTGHTFTVKHAGFKILMTAGPTATLYATQGDGSTENASSALTTLAVNDVLDLTVHVNSGASVDYYWRKNGGAWSSATNLTTNFPTGANVLTTFSVSNNSTTQQFTWDVACASYIR